MCSWFAPCSSTLRDAKHASIVRRSAAPLAFQERAKLARTHSDDLCPSDRRLPSNDARRSEETECDNVDAIARAHLRSLGVTRIETESAAMLGASPPCDPVWSAEDTNSRWELRASVIMLGHKNTPLQNQSHDFLRSVSRARCRRVRKAPVCLIRLGRWYFEFRSSSPGRVEGRMEGRTARRPKVPQRRRVSAALVSVTQPVYNSKFPVRWPGAGQATAWWRSESNSSESRPMGTRPRTQFVKTLKERRCGKCGAKLNTQRIRCKRCGNAQGRPKP